jgi:spore coat polysaccharide biosynthesis protein SpsF
MGRVLGAAQAFSIDTIVELTGDCPLIDPAIIDRCVEVFHSNNVDYCSNILTRTYPIGMDTQVFRSEVLADAYRRTSDLHDREHVSLYIYRHPERYSLHGVIAPHRQTWRDLRLTVDTHEDFELISAVFEQFRNSSDGFGLDQILDFLRNRLDLVDVNRHVEHRYV